jgi:coenzyme PQQ synthesis protein D (PqqD)
MHYRINSPHVVAETLDGETTIVDLESGTYYALNASGSLIWDGLVAGAEPQEASQALASAYGLDRDEAARAVDELTGGLADAKLIVPADKSASNGSRPEPAATNSDGAANGKPYAVPELSTYTDMQELLLLDPIHEVDESGWPTPR